MIIYQSCCWEQQGSETWKLNSETNLELIQVIITCILEIHLSFLNETTFISKLSQNLFWLGFKTFNMRVWSWLRMNAGGVLNTCKSNEAFLYDPFGVTKLWLSGGRVSNAWVTYLIQGDNSWKRLLIPHKRTASHDAVWKALTVWDGPALD